MKIKKKEGGNGPLLKKDDPTYTWIGVVYESAQVGLSIYH